MVVAVRSHTVSAYFDNSVPEKMEAVFGIVLILVVSNIPLARLPVVPPPTNDQRRLQSARPPVAPPSGRAPALAAGLEAGEDQSFV